MINLEKSGEQKVSIDGSVSDSYSKESKSTIALMLVSKIIC